MTQPLSLIPFPRSLSRDAGAFPLSPETAIVTDPPNRRNATWLQNFLRAPTGLPLAVLGDSALAPSEGSIHLCQGGPPEALGCEGYRLTVTPTRVTLQAPHEAGVFYGLQTLRQLLPPDAEARCPVSGVAWEVPCLTIEDAPRFPWRGFMLDEGRHFQGKAEVLRVLDLMALHKLNVLHWHLTEDQGWRLEIKAFPELTAVGSRRAGTSRRLVGGWGHDGVPHGGFYTQAEVAEVVAYAAARHIRIVPEIEVPGHCLAALAAYPELSCTGGPFEVRTRFGISPDIYCAGKEGVFAFLEAVLDEVLALFPSPYVHIGGDEAPKTRWRKCPDCRRRLRDEGLKDAAALQAYFTNRVARHCQAWGRTVIGWDEVLHPDLDEAVVVQYWGGLAEALPRRGPRGVAAALRRGRRVIASAFTHAYLDHSHSLTPLSKAYRYDPGDAGADAAAVLGIEAPLWTEFVRSRARLDYQTFPRLTAFAETGWTPRERKDFADFEARLVGFLRRLDELGVGYAPRSEAEPGRHRQWFGAVTMALPQRKVASQE